MGRDEVRFVDFFVDVINKRLLTKFFLAIEKDVFAFLSLFSLCAFIVIFIVLHVKQKKQPQFIFENRPEKTSNTDPGFGYKKHEIN